MCNLFSVLTDFNHEKSLIIKIETLQSYFLVFSQNVRKVFFFGRPFIWAIQFMKKTETEVNNDKLHVSHVPWRPETGLLRNDEESFQVFCPLFTVSAAGRVSAWYVGESLSLPLVIYLRT